MSFDSTTLSVLVTRPVPRSAVERLAAAGLDVDARVNALGMSADELRAAVRGRHAILCQVEDRMDAATLEAASGSCRIVATAAVGYDNIDVAAARRLGITITNTTGTLTETTADLTWALLLASARQLGAAERTLRRGAWRGWTMMDFLGVDVHGRTLGIVGAGQIGTAVARRANGFNMRLLYCARTPHPEMDALGATRSDLNELLAYSDFVSLHVPLTAQTRHLIDAAALGRMKPGAILINTARGLVVDQAALIAALQAGRLGGAGLDVFENEPHIPPELMAMENVVLLPHIGSATIATRCRMAETAAANIIAVLQGRPPLTPVAGSA